MQKKLAIIALSILSGCATMDKPTQDGIGAGLVVAGVGGVLAAPVAFIGVSTVIAYKGIKSVQGDTP